MRTSISLLFILTIALTLTACGGGAGDPYIGQADGQHFGDDSWIDDPLFFKPGLGLAQFPGSTEGAAVRAVDEKVAFSANADGSLLVRGQPIAGVRMEPTGEVFQDGAQIGVLVYIEIENGQLGVALATTDGRALAVSEDGQIDETGQQLPLADFDPMNPDRLPVATPASAN